MDHAVQESQPHSRAVVWIDHLTAKIFAMGLTGVTPRVVHAHLESSHLHHKANTIGSGKVEDDPKFLAEVSEALDNCNEVLILGPGLEKTALMRHLQSEYPRMMLRLETSDHPTDAEIIAAGRKHFRLDQPPQSNRSAS
jgi:stalled ribosome rescue protein Dom34